MYPLSSTQHIVVLPWSPKVTHFDLKRCGVLRQNLAKGNLTYRHSKRGAGKEQKSCFFKNISFNGIWMESCGSEWVLKKLCYLSKKLLLCVFRTNIVENALSFFGENGCFWPTLGLGGGKLAKNKVSFAKNLLWKDFEGILVLGVNSWESLAFFPKQVDNFCVFWMKTVEKPLPL